ncbi:MAG: hypothetical protein CMK32_02960 [Porticoccaceae bacterium]|nr:hypothetical protein [Porticoccaceae bacterium]|tara:strand:+ start:14775 stop:15551 length:777 start_codon:yes stop_codon:yes gene_type:complete
MLGTSTRRLLFLLFVLSSCFNVLGCTRSGSLGVFTPPRSSARPQPVSLAVHVDTASFTDSEQRAEFEHEYRLLAEELVTNTGRFVLVEPQRRTASLPELSVTLEKIALIQDFPTSRRLLASFASMLFSVQELAYSFSDPSNRPSFSIGDSNTGRELARLSLENEDMGIDLGYWAKVRIEFRPSLASEPSVSNEYENGVYLMGGQEWQSLTIGRANPTERSWRVSNRARLQETTFNTLHWGLVNFLEEYDATGPAGETR